MSEQPASPRHFWSVDITRMGPSAGRHHSAAARVRIGYEDACAMVVLEVNAEERQAAFLRMRPEDIELLGDAIRDASRAMRGRDERSPFLHQE